MHHFGWLIVYVCEWMNFTEYAVKGLLMSA